MSVQSRRLKISCVAVALIALTLLPAGKRIGEAQVSAIEPTSTTKARLQEIVKGVLRAWEKFDVVCLGEDHGSKNDSDLRIALVQHPDFIHTVKAIIIESANVAHQEVLDRFILDGAAMSREQLSVVWKDANGAEVWASPIYEAFLRAVQKTNLTVSRTERVRVLAGDDPRISNRGRFIREAVSRELLEKRLKGLAIYGAGHCECRGGGFPGELADKYPGRIWAVFNFYDVEEGRRVFNLGEHPKLIGIRGTEYAKLPVEKMFFLGRYNDPAKLGDIADAIVYYGDIKDMKVPALEP